MIQKKKNIWIMNHYATNMFFDEGGRHYEFADYLKNKKYMPVIFCASTFHTHQNNIDLKGKKYNTKRVNDIPFVFVKARDYTGNGFSRILNMISFALNLTKITKNIIEIYGKPDIIIASSVHPLTLISGILISRKLKVPIITEVRDLWPEAIFQFKPELKNTFLSKILENGEKWIYSHSDEIIFTKEGDSDYLYEKSWTTKEGGPIDESKLHYINNGVNIDKFNYLIETNRLDDMDLESNIFKVVYVGAIRPVNNVDNILNTAKLLINNSDIIFLIYGDGIERERLEKRLHEEKITNVIFKGFVNKSNIPFILSKSSINLLNYSDNQFNWNRGNSSNKLFEYMASGKPIISTIKMGYSIIDRYKCGIELNVNNEENLAEAIINIKNMEKDNYDNLGNNARIGASDFDYNRLSEKLIYVIEKATKKR